MNATETALYSTLTGGTALTALLAGTASIYNTIGPRGGTFDYVLFQLMGGGDQNESPRRRKELLYLVKGISATSMKNAGLIDAQIDALLHNVTLTVMGWTSISTRRESDVEYVETTPEGNNYFHNGGIYRLRVGI
jgi:hypothetical protein